MSAYLDHLSVALGSQRETVEEAVRAERCLSGADALRSAGFVAHRFCGPGEDAYDLARRAALPIAPALQGAGAIVWASCLPCNASRGGLERFRETRDVKPLMDFPASHLQADFGLERAIVVGLDQQACTGALGALRLARLLLDGEPEIERVACVVADRFPEGALYEQSWNLISDGAAACVVSRERRGWDLLASHQITNGALARASDDETAGAFLAWTHRAVSETLAKAGLAARDVDWFVPQNTSTKAWAILARLLGIAPERVWMKTLPEAAHVISADVLANLADLEESGAVRPGQHALLSMAGYGLNWQCTLLRRV